MSKNCQKLDLFFKTITKNFHFFQKIAIVNLFEKITIFVNFLEKMSSFFFHFLTFNVNIRRVRSPHGFDIQKLLSFDIKKPKSSILLACFLRDTILICQIRTKKINFFLDLTTDMYLKLTFKSPRFVSFCVNPT